MIDPRSLWTISEAEIRSDDVAARELIRVNKITWFDNPTSDRVRVLKEFLLACTFQGAGEVTPNQKRNILFNVTNLEDEEALSQLSELSHELISHGNVDPMWRECLLLGKLSGVEELVSQPTDVQESSDGQLLDDLRKYLEGGDSEPIILKFQDLSNESLKILTDEWSELRNSVLQEGVRYECDIWLIRKGIFSNSAISLNFIDQIFQDDGFWSSSRVTEWAENMGPIKGDQLGTIATAALNSRLRRIVPHSFLRNPDSLVIDKLVRVETIESVQFNQFLEQSKQIFYAICDVEYVLQKARPTKTELNGLLEALENSLLQLRTKRFGKKGKIDSFLPEMHLSNTLIELGASVEILECGLKSSENDQIFIKAKVIARSEPGNEPTGQD